MGLPSVYTVFKLDERRDKEQTLADKVRSVEERLAGVAPREGVSAYPSLPQRHIAAEPRRVYAPAHNHATFPGTGRGGRVVPGVGFEPTRPRKDRAF